MFRSAVFFVTLGCCAGLVASATEPFSPVVVVSDRSAASVLPPLPPGSTVVLLIRANDEPDQVVDARALAMRHATHFAYLGGQESSLMALYRERLTTQGAVAIDLRRLPTRGPLRLPETTLPDRPFYASLTHTNTR